MVARGERGSVVSLICDSGERYAHTYYCDEWMAAKGFNLDPHAERIEKIVNTARWYS
jgi:cysteine synthase A